MRQNAGAEIATGQAYECRVVLDEPTIDNNLVIVVAVLTGSHAKITRPPDGFTLIRERIEGDLKVAVWYRQAAPSMSSVTVGLSHRKAMQVRVFEYRYGHQSNALDKVAVFTSTTNLCRTGTLITAQDDSIIFAVVANRNASCTQQGFTGGLIKLVESTSPLTGAGIDTDIDDRRTRLTVHQAVTTAITTVGLTAKLSSARNWVAMLISFRGGSLGPARLTSRKGGGLRFGGTAALTVFGALRTVTTAVNDPLRVGGKVQMRIGPFDYQYRLNGWDGLLIGAGTGYDVVSIDGLEGWDMRTSDADQPRGEGALRGTDLQAPRLIVFQVDAGGTETEVETALDLLYRALIPQRDEDWELIWRHPGRPLRLLRCRPTNLIRGLDYRTTLLQEQKFALRCADPRHYAAGETIVAIPPSPAAAPSETSVVNIGNAPAYPLIRVVGAGSTPVTRIELVNTTTDVTFDVQAILPAGATLLGDMPARSSGAPRSIVTIDGQSKYGGWQFPREAFRLNPGLNSIALRTVPDGAPVTCTLTYRDTWSG